MPRIGTGDTSSGGWWGERSGGEIAGSPEIPAGDRAPGLPTFGALAHEVGLGQEIGRDLLCGLETEEGERETFAHSVVVDRQHVGAAETKDEQHLDGPTTDAAHLAEVLDDGF